MSSHAARRPSSTLMAPLPRLCNSGRLHLHCAILLLLDVPSVHSGHFLRVMNDDRQSVVSPLHLLTCSPAHLLHVLPLRNPQALFISKSALSCSMVSTLSALRPGVCIHMTLPNSLPADSSCVCCARRPAFPSPLGVCVCVCAKVAITFYLLHREVSCILYAEVWSRLPRVLTIATQTQ